MSFLFPLPTAARIRGIAVPAFFPESGPLHSVVYGEAPGPRGADKSGLPFWGDGAGVPLYRALCKAGCAVVPDGAWGRWDGARFAAEGLRPMLTGVALSNAFPACPTNDGLKFRAPTRTELRSESNVARLRSELQEAVRRGASQVVTLGKCAAGALALPADEAGLSLVTLVHPSAQGLLSEAPDRGRGQRLADLQEGWIERLASLLSHR